MGSRDWREKENYRRVRYQKKGIGEGRLKERASERVKGKLLTLVVENALW